MGAPGGGLKQCAQGRGQDRTSVGSPHMPKATFPFVTARQWVDGWRLFFLNTATVSGGHSPWILTGHVRVVRSPKLRFLVEFCRIQQSQQNSVTAEI